MAVRAGSVEDRDDDPPELATPQTESCTGLDLDVTVLTDSFDVPEPGAGRASARATIAVPRITAGGPAQGAAGRPPAGCAAPSPAGLPEPAPARPARAAPARPGPAGGGRRSQSRPGNRAE